MTGPRHPKGGRRQVRCHRGDAIVTLVRDVRRAEKDSLPAEIFHAMKIWLFRRLRRARAMCSEAREFAPASQIRSRPRLALLSFHSRAPARSAPDVLLHTWPFAQAIKEAQTYFAGLRLPSNPKFSG